MHEETHLGPQFPDMGLGPPEVTDPPMTLVLAAIASDGVVVASDRRDFRKETYQYHDYAIKQRRLPGGVLVCFTGAGQWAEALLDETTSMSVTANALETARAVARMLDTDFPEVTFYFAGTVPKPSLAFLMRKPIGQTYKWAPATWYARPWIVGGFDAMAGPLVAHFWRPTMLVEEVASLLTAAIKLTAASIVTVSPTYDVDVTRAIGAPWQASDAALVEERACEFLKKLGEQKP